MHAGVVLIFCDIKWNEFSLSTSYTCNSMHSCFYPKVVPKATTNVDAVPDAVTDANSSSNSHILVS